MGAKRPKSLVITKIPWIHWYFSFIFIPYTFSLSSLLYCEKIRLYLIVLSALESRQCLTFHKNKYPEECMKHNVDTIKLQIIFWTKHLSIYEFGLSVCLSVCLSIYLYIYLSVYFCIYLLNSCTLNWIYLYILGF